ncbi:MAG TPA: response regulator transcription factor [Burkholderiales bacterium]|nr:response regulator transcription factor [Burkholderiales bacterium]
MTGAQPIHVLLVDDHRSVLWGLGKLIWSASPQMKLAGSVTCQRDALAAVKKYAPDIVLLDLDLGEESGVDLVSKLCGASRVLILTGSQDAEAHQRAMLAGARGILHKAEPAEVILKAIARVHAGELWLDRGSLGKLLSALSRRAAETEESPAHSTLTAAERKVVAAVMRYKGSPNKVVAAFLHLSEHTLRNHLASIYSKLGIHRRVDLVLYGIEHKLGTLPS